MSGLPAFVFDTEHTNVTNVANEELAVVLQRNVVAPVMTTTPDRHMATKTSRRNKHKYRCRPCLHINDNTDVAHLVLFYGSVTLPKKLTGKTKSYQYWGSNVPFVKSNQNIRRCIYKVSRFPYQTRDDLPITHVFSKALVCEANASNANTQLPGSGRERPTAKALRRWRRRTAINSRSLL